MENPNKSTKQFSKIVGGSVIADKSKMIDMPPQKAIALGIQAMILNGEMDIQVGKNTLIQENGKVVARISNDQYPRVLVSKQLGEEESVRAVKKYMEEKGIQSVKEIIKTKTAKPKQERTVGMEDR